MKIKKQKNKGFVALTSVLLLSAFFVIMFIAMSFFATEILSRGTAEEINVKVLARSNSCAQVALNELKKNDNYSVTDQTIDVNGKTCTIESVSTDTGSNITTIKTSADFDGHVKKTTVEVDVENWRDLTIISWRETDF